MRNVAVFVVACCSLIACGDDTGSGGEAGQAQGGGGAAQGGGGADGGGGSADGGGGASQQSVTIQLDARVNGVAFDCAASYDGLGTADTSASLLDFRLYVHDVRLLSGQQETPLALDQDGVWQLDTVALLDFEDNTGTCANGTTETNATLRGQAPAGAYDGIRFRLGVPEALNHQDKDSAPSPLNLTAMHWDWQSGYKFLRIDAMPTGADGPFLMHLGSTECTGDPATDDVTCARPNIIEVTLTGFDPSSDTIVVDYGALVAGADLSQDLGGAPGCMSGTDDPECAPTFQSLGIDIATGAMSPETQTLFSVAP